MKTRYSLSYLLLFAQLLVFFFVSSLTITSSKVYASTGVNLTDIKNYCYNIGISQSKIDSLDWSQLESDLLASNHIVLNDNSGAWIYLIKGDYNNNYIYTTSGNYNSGNGLYSSNGNSNCALYRVGNGIDTVIKISWSNTSTIHDKFYTNVAFRGRWSNKWHDITGYTMPYMRPSSLFDGPYTDYIPLTFLSTSSDTFADVWTYEDIPVYRFSGDEDLYIGQLYQPISSNCYETNNNFFYMWGNWQYRDLTPYCTYTEYIGSDESGSTYDVYLDKNYFYPNTLYNLVWTDTSTDPYTLAAANFYLGDENTVIIDGVIDPSRTFSGDYKDQYDYENDPNQNFWKDTYNKFMTPSGEVLRGTITTLMSDLDFTTSGEESGELMMALVGLDLISNDFGDFIISWDDFSPNLTVKGQVVSSSGPFIPAGQINFSQMERNNETFHDIMQYTRAILSFTVISLFFSNLWHTLLITLGISTQIYEKDQQAKEKMARQAERDQRRQEREDRNRYQQWLYEHRR